MTAKALRWASAVLCASLLCGCEHDEYSVEMVPQGAALLRRLTVARLDRPTDTGKPIKYFEFPEERLKQLDSLYKRRLPSENSAVHVFEDSFQGKLPGEFGGAGTYTRIVTQMGECSAYLETVGGSDDLAGEMRRRQKAADRLMDLSTGWIGERLAGEKERKLVLRFMDTDLRQDAGNLGLHIWLGQNQSSLAGSGAQPFDAAARLGAYLLSRGYFSADDLPVLARAVSHPENKEQLAAVSALFRGFLERKVGLKDPGTIESLLALLRDPEASGKLFAAYLRRTPEYKAELKRWRKEGLHPKADAEPDPMSVMSGLSDDAFDVQLFSFASAHAAQVNMSLAAEGDVLTTDGAFDASLHRITWKGSWEAWAEGRRALPAVHYAVWCREDRTFQDAHFGKIVLSGEELRNYSLWRNSLTEAEAREWDAFVGDLRPGEGLTARLGGFKFADERTAPTSYAETAVGPIQLALTK